MADKKANIDPRFMKYNKEEIQEILDRVANPDMASEDEVRAIVTGYAPTDGGSTEQ